jgi:rhodanese-related sulfurtransferase
MRFRNALLAATITITLSCAVFAREDKHTHGYNSAKATDSIASRVSDKPQITATDLKQRLDKGEKITIIDARHDLGGQILKGAIHVPTDKLEDWAKDVDKNATIVTYCTCPHDEAADAEVEKLRQMGFKNSYALTGGLEAARIAGFEVVTPADK